MQRCDHHWSIAWWDWQGHLCRRQRCLKCKAYRAVDRPLTEANSQWDPACLDEVFARAEARSIATSAREKASEPTAKLISPQFTFALGESTASRQLRPTTTHFPRRSLVEE